ncbi:small ubiquitin-related modifier 3-like [Rhopalosiphum maidis]|uniref:small ubiquitin-related modifier 3-like n=1 Tax=Rhopalosiphum maidis TaxID=43146 RepID=UPI000EFDB8E1|nr:small ubiquitin-related modifier 3-like [Rhopalosiphum maidis]XP_026820762.1 small ubiquitin-related modifier 3-like [Rhopalosiphum maidis]
MIRYCEMKHLNRAKVRFLFDGRIIVDADTPSFLEIEDDDTIEVFGEQTSKPIHYSHYTVTLGPNRSQVKRSPA